MLSFYFLGFNQLLKFSKKLILFLIFFITLIGLFFYFFNQDKKNLPDDTVISQSTIDYYKFIKNTKNNHPQLKNFIQSYEKFSCILVGDLCTDNPKDFYKNSSKSFAGQLENFLLIPLTHPPASGLAWTKITLENFGFIPKTYAYKGIGFSSIQPLISLWKIFRDIAFLILVLVIVLIGFLIMFRAKINPQTIISIENSLPKIVIALILITFSFPIAGFLIDLMNVTIVVIISLLSKNQYVNIDISSYISKVFTGSFGSFLGETLFKDGNVFLTGPAILSFLPILLRIVLKIIASIAISVVIKNQYESLIKEGLAKSVPFIGGLLDFLINLSIYIFKNSISIILISSLLPFLISLIILFTGLYIYIKIIVMILKAYISNLLLIIVSPILLLFEAIPGKNTFTWWIKSLLGNLIIFPVIVTILIISRILLYALNDQFISFPFITNIHQNSLAILISFGITFLIPDIINYIRDSLGIKPSPINIGLGTFFAGAGAAVAGMSKASMGLTSFISTPLIGSGIQHLLGPKISEKISPPQRVQFSQEQLKILKELLGKDINQGLQAAQVRQT